MEVARSEHLPPADRYTDICGALTRVELWRVTAANPSQETSPGSFLCMVLPTSVQDYTLH